MIGLGLGMLEGEEESGQLDLDPMVHKTLTEMSNIFSSLIYSQKL